MLFARTDTASTWDLEEESDLEFEVDEYEEEPVVSFTAFPAMSDMMTAMITGLVERSQLTQAFGLDEDATTLLLALSSWNNDRACEAYMNNEPAARRAAGLPPAGTALGQLTAQDPGSPEMCNICCDDEADILFFALSCDHRYCVSCFGRYMKEEIYKGQMIACPDGKCSLVIPFLWIQVLAGPSGYADFLSAVGNVYVHSSRHYRGCPAVDCNCVIKCTNYVEPKELLLAQNIGRTPVVQCTSNHRFCFGCVNEDHVPAPCQVAQAWVTKCEDDLETVKWIASNTRDCPRCDSAIEKNGGCNHMTCRSCRYEFCWICMGDWVLHGRNYYECNRFRREEQRDRETAASAARELLRRYMHYYNLHRNHGQLLEQDLKLYRNVIVPHFESSRDGLLLLDKKFIANAHEALVSARRTLKWTYVVAYYLAPTNFLEIFESNQDFLTKTIEELSGIMAVKKQNIDSLWLRKFELVELASLVRSRQEMMIRSANDGFVEGSLIVKLAD